MATIRETILPTKKPDIITPHRLSVAILIRIFQKIRESDNCFQALPEQIKRKYVRDFCIFILKVIQSPDVSLEELMGLLVNDNYSIHTNLIRKFENTICSISDISIRYLQDVVDSIGRMITPTESLARTSTINRNSVIGYYLRRLVTYFDKLSFSEVTKFWEAFRAYSHNLVKNVDTTSMTLAAKNKSTQDEWMERGQWSRRQAELFLATQALLLQNNEEKAMSPKELNRHITSLLKANYDLSEAHFLSYLNFLRVKEFCGALDSLHQCFDKNVSNDGRGTADEKTKGYRYAALNLAVLQFRFGNREEARQALEEAINMAQEAGDNICLQHALAWMYCIVPDQKCRLIEHSILKSLELNLNYLMSLGIQAFVQQAGLTSGNPKHIFDTITKSDILNCQHMHSDLIASSYSQKAALWQLYGKSEISSLISQLHLYANTDDSSFSALSKTHYGEGYCQAVCNIANQMLLQGEYVIVNSILNFVKERFPNEPTSHIWMLCENMFHFTLNLHQENFAEAELAAQKISIVDKDESLLRLAELNIQRQNYKEVHPCVTKVFDNNNDSNMMRIDHHIRAMILLIDTQIASVGPNSVISGIVNVLNSTYMVAKEHHLDYLVAMVLLRVAHVQLLMGQSGQAMVTLERCLVQILGHGGCYDRGRAMLLYAKCVVANIGQFDVRRSQLIHDACKMLDKVKENFTKIGAFYRVIDVLYLQGVLYNDIDSFTNRNNCALQIRLLEEEHPNKHTSNLLRML